MKVAFLTNYLTHHQVPFCTIMYEKLGDNFKTILMRTADTEQKNLGYKELNDLYPFIIKTYESKEMEEYADSFCENADVVILGSAPWKYIAGRMKNNKLTFIYTERLFKKGLIYALHPSRIKYIHKRFVVNRSKKLYYLCAGGYVKKDINLFTCTPDKFFKWGYFPETKKYENVEELIENKASNSIIWVARYIDWKHPEIAIEIGKRLKEAGYEFEINMVGNGVMLDEMKKKVVEESLQDKINILGSVSSNLVRGYMERAAIHIFTSDRQEGWGAVLNESMNSACAVVANEKIGAVPYLIEDGMNGFTYMTIDELYEKVEFLLNNTKKRKEISMNAYKTIIDEWNAELSTERLIKLCEGFLKSNPPVYKSGPCSRA